MGMGLGKKVVKNDYNGKRFSNTISTTGSLWRIKTSSEADHGTGIGNIMDNAHDQWKDSPVQ